MRLLACALLLACAVFADAQRRRRAKTTSTSTSPPAVCTPKAGAKLRLGSFNIQAFGISKMKNNAAVSTIVNIFGRYDMVVILETRDSSGTALPSLVEKLNQQYPDNTFSYVESERLGKSVSKEQYVLAYRSGIKVVGTYQYADEDRLFERPPYLAVVQLPNKFKFGIMMIHTKPENAVAEIDGLLDAYSSWSEALKLSNIIIAGDFNADCSYVPKKAWSQIRLRTDTKFKWLIGDDDDTTTSPSTVCAYDRFVIAGSKLQAVVDDCTAKEFRYDDYYGLSRDQATEISDHYPIEVSLVVQDDT